MGQGEHAASPERSDVEPPVRDHFRAITDTERGVMRALLGDKPTPEFQHVR